MKILVPLEIPEGSCSLTISATAASMEEKREIDYDYGTSEIWEFARSWKLFEKKVLESGLL